MKAKNKLGIWMDHSIAHLMEFTTKPVDIIFIESKLTENEEKELLAKTESLQNSKEKMQLSDYYKKLSEAIKNYKRIILFGPTSAKVELFDVLSEDNRFLKMKVEIKDTDYMTESQQQDFVMEYFSRA